MQQHTLETRAACLFWQGKKKRHLDNIVSGAPSSGPNKSVERRRSSSDGVPPQMADKKLLKIANGTGGTSFSWGS